MQKIVERQRKYHLSGATRDYNFRIEQLQKLQAMLKRYEKDIYRALKADLNKSKHEVITTELGILHTEIEFTLKHLKEWMEDEDRAIIFASHQAEDIKKLADYMMLLKSGTQLQTIEKDVLTEQYRKYWFSDKLKGSPVPGEISRSGNEIISNNATATETYFRAHNMKPMNSSAMELEEIIALLLS